jgi:hypothetical protein
MFRFFFVALVLWLCGCASHSDHTKAIRSALDAGQPGQALGFVNEQLEVDDEKELPEKTGGKNALFLLDRAMILQQLGQNELSSRDLEIADKEIDLLDLSHNTGHDLAKYLCGSASCRATSRAIQSSGAR